MSTNNSFHRSVLFATLLAALTACGGGGSSPTPIVAQQDALTLGTGQTGSVLTNDTVGGAAARVGSGGNATLSFTGTLPQGVTAVDGTVSVARGTAPGSYTLSYQLCEAAAITNCATGTVALTVPTPVIKAVNDVLTVGLGESISLLANDLLDGIAATPATVVASTSAALPTGITLGADGVLAVGGTATPASSTVTYRICQAGVPTNCADASVNLTVVSRLTVTGRVVNGLTGQPIRSLDVSLGSITALTDERGQFTLTGVLPTARAAVKFFSPVYSEGSRIISIGTDGVKDVLARLVPQTLQSVVEMRIGGTVATPAGTASVSLGIDSMERVDGAPLSGVVAISITVIDPSLDSSLMPGDYTTVSGGNVVPIESFGAISVQVSDQEGAELRLRPGQLATIRIPLRTRSADAPTTIPLFYFDHVTGRWIQEGSAVLQGTGTGRYYEAKVSHFSVWNADRIAETVWVNGCVSDSAGTRVAGAQVSSDGIDYSGTTSAVSDAAGAFRIPVRINSQATLIGLNGTRVSNTLRVTSGSGELNLSECLVLAANANGVSIKLTWGAKPSDLDSHLWTPSGAHVFFSSKGQLAADPFANLDVDDTSSFGPEVITLTKLMVGTYKYAVRNYSGFSDGAMANSGARVELVLPGGRTELFVPPATGESDSIDYWTLFDLKVDAQCNVTVTRTEGYTGTPATVPTAAPVYCVKP